MTQQPSAAHLAIRTSAAYARLGTTVPLWLRGPQAREAALKVLTSRLLLRDGQAQQSLMLDASGRPIADVTVCADDEDYLLLVDGLGPDALTSHLTPHLAGLDVALEDASKTHEVLSVHGPFSWELLSQVLGPDLMAMPYLNFFRMDDAIALRSGKTGEYGYELVVPKERVETVESALVEQGVAFDAARLDAAALSLAQFEGWFFDAGQVPSGATPIELQLQWRLSARDFVGKDAIDAWRAQLAAQPGLAKKLACVLLSEKRDPGDALSCEGENVGALVRVEYSESAGFWMGAAMLSARYAHAGLELLVDGTAARTIAPPLLDNRSLYVDPRRHSYGTRDEIAFGPLTRHRPVVAT